MKECYKFHEKGHDERSIRTYEQVENNEKVDKW